jgi:hypothetical protein
MSQSGPLRRFAAMQQDVGNGGQTGRSGDAARAGGDSEPVAERSVYRTLIVSTLFENQCVEFAFSKPSSDTFCVVV